MRLLAGTGVTVHGTEDGPAWRAGRALAELGAELERRRSRLEVVSRSDGHSTDIAWTGGTSVESEYVGLIAASACLAGSRRIAPSAISGLTEGVARPDAEIIRCADGWLVARWRSLGEARLLDRMVGGATAATRSEAWAAAREARLLVAPVRARRRVSSRLAELGQADSWSSRSRTVVDWTNLWAGPWATGQLAGDRDVIRVELPGRRDGLLATRRGRIRWRRWNGSKRLVLLDARRTPDRDRLGELIGSADVLVFGQSGRVLPQLGFDDSWFARHAPHVFRLSLTAYDDPYSDLPGLGEHAAALSGLLWRGPISRPAPPYPWADPLLGAWALLVLRARDAGGRPAGGHIRLSLEGAAARATVHVGRGR